MYAFLRYAAILMVGLTLGWIVSLNLQAPKTSSQPEPKVDQKPLPTTAVEAAPVSTPTGASNLREILQIPSDFQQTAALYRLALTANRSQLESLIAEAAQLDQVSERRAATSILYARYGELEPEAAVDHILSDQGVYTNRWLDSVFHAWSRHDLEAAIDRLAELPRSRRSAAGAALLNARDDLPIDERRQIAQRLGIESTMVELEMRRQMAMTDTDPQGAWEAALAANPQVRVQQLYRVAAAWATSDPRTAMDAIASLTEPSTKAALIRQVTSVWAGNAPQEAIQWALSQPASSYRGETITGAMAALAAADPMEATQLLDTLSSPDQEKALEGVIQGWVTSDPRAAAQWYATTDFGENSRAVMHLATAYASKYPEEVAPWLDSLPSQAAATVRPIAFSVIAQRDPLLAAELANQVDDGQGRANALQNVLGHWAEVEPSTAGRWIANLEDSDIRPRLYTRLMRRWADYDQSAALQFANGLLTTAERDAALVGIISQSTNDQQLSERLYAEIQTEDQRRAAALQLYHRLNQTDPKRAEIYRAAAEIQPP